MKALKVREKNKAGEAEGEQPRQEEQEAQRTLEPQPGPSTAAD